MEILLIHQYFLEPDDGGGSRFNEMTKLWAEAGHGITVLAGMMHANAREKRKEYKGKYWLRKEHGKVEVWRCHVSESYNRGFAGRLRGYFSFVFSSILTGIFKVKGKYDIILVTSPPLFVGMTAYVLSLLKRAPFVFEVRDLWPESAIDTGVLKNKWIIRLAYWFEALMYRKAILVNVLTPAFRDTLVKEKNVPPEKVILVPNAADFTLAEELQNGTFNAGEFRRKIGWEDKFVITYVGAHGVANHLVQVLDAAERIRDKMPNVLFVLVGDGMEKPKLVRMAKERNLENVRFMDPVPKREVFKYILASDMGASILKKVDTFKTIYSNKTFDYMSCRKPVFLAIDGVSRQLVDEAACGIFVEPEDAEDYKGKLEAILDLGRDTLDQMGQNGYRYAKEHFDRRKLAFQYIDSIKETLQYR